MAQLALSADAKATMRANLELELNARKEKLLAMCEAQVASLRSRLERRVNRVPNNKRQINIVTLIGAALPTKPAPAKKEVAPAVARKTRAPAKEVAPKPATRGTKRTSNEISADDKENDLVVSKKRAKVAPRVTATATATATTTTTTTSRTTRTTRAASRKVVPAAPQILSPKTNNARPAAPAARSRRPR